MKEFKLFESITSSKNLMYGVTLIMITCYFTSYFLLGTFEIAKTTILSLPILTSVITCIYAHLQFIQNREKPQSSFFLLTTYFGIVLMASLPLVIHSNVCIEINISMINLPFMLLAAGYFYQLTQNNKREFEALRSYGYYSEQNDIEKYDLTDREMEIAKLILEEKTYDQITEIMFISYGTVTKHASNIFKKTGCKKHEEFIKKFRSDS
jgi:DNA-binding CsgD family transcriptional regulator